MKSLIFMTILLKYVAGEVTVPSLVRSINLSDALHPYSELLVLPNGDLVILELPKGDDEGIIIADNGAFQIWNAVDGVLKTRLSYPLYPTRMIYFSLSLLPNGDLVGICTSLETYAIQVWNSTSGILKRSFEKIYDTFTLIVNSIGLPNGDLAVGTGKDVHIYDTNDGTLKNILSGHTKSDHRFEHFAVWSDGGYLISGAHDGQITFWNMNNGYSENTQRGRYKSNAEVNALAVLSNGYLISSWSLEFSDTERWIWIHNLNNEMDTHWIPMEELVLAIVPLPNGDFVCGSDDGKIRVRSPKGALKSEFQAHSGDWVYALALLPNGYLASTSWDKKLNIWDMNADTQFTLNGHTDSILSVVKLLNGDVASSSKDNTIRIWDTSNGSLKRTLTGHTDWVQVLVVLPSGDLVSGSDDTTIKIWSTVTGELKRTLYGHLDWVRALAVLPSGDLISGSDDRTIRIWSTVTGELKRVISDHKDRVRQLTVLSENRFVSGSDDKTVRIWSV